MAEKRLFKFQNDCVGYLLDKVSRSHNEEKIFIQSPTGSGKTLILQTFIKEFLLSVRRNTVFVWLCPGDGALQTQSYAKMRLYYPQCATGLLSDVLTTGFAGATTYFINWQKIIGKDRLAITYGEKANLYDKIREAHNSRLEFVLIIDEEHRNDTEKAREVISAFKAIAHIRASATVKTSGSTGNLYTIDELDVIDSGLITKALYINADCDDKQELSLKNEAEYLTGIALSQRTKLAAAYKEEGTDINPLVLIQFPPKSEELVYSVEDYLEKQGISYLNGYLAKWFANEKQNIETVTEHNSLIKVLLFKQGIATGWDCPRAKILVKLRDNMSETFEIQTVGRIRRMPEQRHYENELLNYAYLYTFDARYTMEVMRTIDYAYSVKRVYLKDKCRNFRIDNNRLTKKMRYSGNDREILDTLYYFMMKKYHLTEDLQENRKILEGHGYQFGTVIERDVAAGKVVKTDSLVSAETLSRLHLTTYINPQSNRLDLLDARQQISQVMSVPLDLTRRLLMRLFLYGTRITSRRILALDKLEYVSFTIKNKDLLKNDFREACTALYEQGYQDQLELMKHQFQKFILPIEEIYKITEGVKKNYILERNAYDDYTADILYAGKSNCEMFFEKYCNKCENVDWFYKNGDKGDRYFSIIYRTGVGIFKLFYPDYIVRLKNGQTWIIETKGGERNNQDQNIDPYAPAKFEALKEYCKFKRELHFAFVRDWSATGQDTELCWTDTEYHDSLQHECWKNIDCIFTQ